VLQVCLAQGGVAVNWGRYAELVEVDASRGQVTLEEAGTLATA
jgi:hypothetical protein